MTGSPGKLISAPVLVVEKQAKLSELDSRYTIRDDQENVLGNARQADRGPLKAFARLMTEGRAGQELQVTAAGGTAVFTLKRSARLGLARVSVADGAGRIVGGFAQTGIRELSIDVEGASRATVRAAGGGAYEVLAADGAHLAAVVRTTKGVAKKLFTKGDKYLLKIHAPLDEPLRSLVVVAPLALDIALPREAYGQEVISGGGN